MHSTDMLFCPWNFSWQEYWSGLPFLPSEDPGIKPASPVSPVLHVDSLSTEPSGKSFLRFSEILRHGQIILRKRIFLLLSLRSLTQILRIYVQSFPDFLLHMTMEK
jgi:hypothetical protein